MVVPAVLATAGPQALPSHQMIESNGFPRVVESGTIGDGDAEWEVSAKRIQLAYAGPRSTSDILISSNAICIQADWDPS